MLLQIDDNIYVADIQEKFNECFPFLKIEFYNTKHKWQETSDITHLIHPKTLIGNIRNKHKSGSLEVKSWYKTGKVEQDFKNHFGLNVQIFRLQGKHWIQTSHTDELTLQQQNEIAESSVHKDEPFTMKDEELDI